jgi:hypothetical protein
MKPEGIDRTTRRPARQCERDPLVFVLGASS